MSARGKLDRLGAAGPSPARVGQSSAVHTVGKRLFPACWAVRVSATWASGPATGRIVFTVTHRGSRSSPTSSATDRLDQPVPILHETARGPELTACALAPAREGAHAQHAGRAPVGVGLVTHAQANIGAIASPPRESSQRCVFGGGARPRAHRRGGSNSALRHGWAELKRRNCRDDEEPREARPTCR